MALVTAGRSILRAFHRLDELLATVEGTAACLLLAEMILLAFVQVILRNVFAFGFSWVEELLRVSVLWVGFIGASLAIRQGRHINIDVLSRAVPDRLRPWVRTVIDLALLAVCAIFLAASVEYIRMERQFGEVSDPLRTPVWILQLIFPILFGTGCFRLALKTVENVAALRGERRP